ncbi:hypothetical protein [Streptomyces zaehneri]|uniref:hypothetical protein n=1 Tax=Streptomyces zaehneri TaxID=3051180 RepID=UPI0028D54BD5|nr:hypothetical protein [Streptomyces sp. DSM 40713]
MTKSHGRKSRARNKSRTRGAAYAAANAGTLHHHGSAPSNEDLQPVDPGRWGVETAPDMWTASALIGARIEQCAPCLESLTAKLLDEDPIVLAVTAESVFRLQPADEWPNAGGIAGKSTQIFYLLVQHVRYTAGDYQMLPGAVERMTCADRAALLDDVLGLWAMYGPKYSGLLRGPDANAVGLADLAITIPGSEPNGGGPGTAIDVSGLTHPVSGGRPAEGIGPAPRPAAPGRSARRPVLHAIRTRQHQPPVTTTSKESRIHMSENTPNIEQHAEGAARSLVELVSALQYGGIKYPLEAYHILSYLTRAAGEMRTALDLLQTSVQGLDDRGLLMPDYRGEPLDEVMERFTESSGRARDLAGGLHGNLSTAHSAVGHLAYNEASEVPGEPEGQESATGS